MNTRHYLDTLQTEIQQIYQLLKAGKSDHDRKQRAEGYIKAGLILGILNQQELTTLVDNIHLQVMGETRSARLQREADLLQLKADDPDKYFDIPAILRHS